MTNERFSLKDHLFNRESVSYLAGLFASADSDFDSARFERAVISAMPDLELKQRVSMIAEVLADHLSDDFEEAADQIKAALPPPLDPTLNDDDFGDFIIAPLGEFVAKNGLSASDFETSMSLLKELTMRFSMEGPIRPFLVEFPQKTLERLGEWALDSNYHVRRLVSEGTRPTLPWAPRIGLDIERPLPFLDVLHADPTRFVTRSVANHLNDISKMNPELVYMTLMRWRDEGRQRSDELQWMTRHSLRTLAKKGDPGAMELLGFSPAPLIEVGSIKLDAPGGEVRMGEDLHFHFELTARQTERLLIDYEIDFVKKNGTTKPRVFKLRQIQMTEGDTTTLEKTHRLKKNASTFTLYPGTHKVSLKVNGRLFPGTNFMLTE